MYISTKYTIYKKLVLLQQLYNLIWLSEDSQKDGYLRNKLRLSEKKREQSGHILKPSTLNHMLFSALQSKGRILDTTQV